MQDDRYCYPDSEVLINKLDIRDEADLFTAEKELTFIRIQELQENPIIGAFDFAHLKRIHLQAALSEICTILCHSYKIHPLSP